MNALESLLNQISYLYSIFDISIRLLKMMKKETCLRNLNIAPTMVSIILVITIGWQEVCGQIRIITPRWPFKCENGPGAFPHATDCQRQYDQYLQYISLFFRSNSKNFFSFFPTFKNFVMCFLMK